MTTLLQSVTGTSGKKGRILIYVCLLLLLPALPVHTDKDGMHLPVLRFVDEGTRNYCADQLSKVAAAAAITIVVDGVLSVLEEVRIPVINIAPGKALSGRHEAIKTLLNALLLCSLLLATGATAMGMLPIFCFKVLIPTALFLRILYICRPETFAWAGKTARPLATGAILLWLFFPVTMLLTKCVNHVFLDARLAAEMRTMEAETTKLSTTWEKFLQAPASPPEAPVAPAPPLPEVRAKTAEMPKARTAPAAPTPNPASEPANKDSDQRTSGLLSLSIDIGNAASSAVETAGRIVAALNPMLLAEKMKEKITEVADFAKEFMSRLLQVAAIFLLTTIVLPAGVLVCFIMIFNALNPRVHAAPLREQASDAASAD